MGRCESPSVEVQIGLKAEFSWAIRAWKNEASGYTRLDLILTHGVTGDAASFLAILIGAEFLRMRLRVNDKPLVRDGHTRAFSLSLLIYSPLPKRA